MINKALFVLVLMLHIFLFSCSTTKPAIDNTLVLKDYQSPYKVFSVGYWRPGYSIITLTDASQNYFVIRTLNVDSLKVGAEYNPR